MTIKYKITIVAGPTASGKTKYAIDLAKKKDAEIINADSLQVYQENPILSAQPSLSEKQNIPHHLFGYISGSESYSVARWIKDASQLICQIDRPIILVGGTGFYLKHLIFGLSPIPEIPLEIKIESENLLKTLGNFEFHQLLNIFNPEVAQRLAPNNSKRVLRAYQVFKATGRSIDSWQKESLSQFSPTDFEMIILNPPRDILYQNANLRLLKMIEDGALNEVKSLLKHNYPPFSSILKTHGIPELSSYLSGEYTLSQAVEGAQQHVRNYAKRQVTWFKNQFIHPELKVNFLDSCPSAFSE